MCMDYNNLFDLLVGDIDQEDIGKQILTLN